MESAFPDYVDKVKRVKYNKMVEVLRVMHPTITQEDVRKKIHILRTSYRRESNKVKRSKQSSSSMDDIYVPILWYYKELPFLEDQMEHDVGITTVEDQVSNICF